MPPNEDILGTGETGTPAGTPGSAGDSGAGEPSSRLTEEATITQLGTVLNGLGGFVQETRDEIASMKEALTAAQSGSSGSSSNNGAGNEGTPEGMDPLFARFYNDPKGVGEEIAKGALEGSNMASNLGSTLDGMAAFHLEQEQTAFDATYGDGMFAQHIRPAVEKALNDAPNQGLKASKGHVAGLVDAAKGQRALEDTLATGRKTVEDTKREQPPPMFGSGAPAPTEVQSKLTPDQEAFADEQGVDKDRYLALHQALKTKGGVTLSEYQAMKKEATP